MGEDNDTQKAADTLNERIAELEHERDKLRHKLQTQVGNLDEAIRVSDMLRREVETLHARIAVLIESRPRSPALTDVDTDHTTTHERLFATSNVQTAAWWHGLAEHTRTELQRVLSTHDVYSLLGAVEVYVGDATADGYNRGRAAALAEAPVGKAIVELAAAVQAPPEADDRIAVSRDAFNQLVSAVSAAAVDEYERGRR